MELSGNAEYDSDSWGSGIKLTSAGVSQFGSTLVVPSDLEPTGLDIAVDILVYNPPTNGACHAEIRLHYRTGYRPGAGTIPIGFAPLPVFPSFSVGGSTAKQTYILNGMESGDALYFGWARMGNDGVDTCGDVRLVGMNIRI